MRRALGWLACERHGKREVVRAASRIAVADESDSDAVLRLKPVVDRHPYGARRAIELIGRLGERTFEDDRAYRLLAAAIHGKPVAPIPAARRRLFEREAWLGRVPLIEAFKALADRDPRLHDLAESARTAAAEHPSPPTDIEGGGAVLPFRIGESDALCESDLARSIPANTS